MCFAQSILEYWTGRCRDNEYLYERALVADRRFSTFATSRAPWSSGSELQSHSHVRLDVGVCCCHGVHRLPLAQRRHQDRRPLHHRPQPRRNRRPAPRRQTRQHHLVPRERRLQLRRLDDGPTPPEEAPPRSPPRRRRRRRHQIPHRSDRQGRRRLRRSHPRLDAEVVTGHWSPVTGHRVIHSCPFA